MKRKGFTLIEVVVVSVLAGVVGLGVLQTIIISNKTISDITKETMFNYNANLLMSDIGNDVKEGYILDTDGYELHITKNNGGFDEIITWKIDWYYNSPEDYGNNMVRVSDDGSERRYHLYGGSKGWRETIPSYYVSKTGAYFDVEVHLLTIMNNVNWTDRFQKKYENRYWCRTREDGVY